MINTLALNKCRYNNGAHVPVIQAPIKCSLFGTYGPAIRKCQNCNLHMPKAKS